MSNSAHSTPAPLWIKGAWIILFFILLGWFCKLDFFLDLQKDQHVYTIITWDNFPDFTVLSAMAWIWYWLPSICVLLVLVRKRWAMITASVVLLISSLGTSTQINLHNDATFVVSFWASFWLLCWSVSASDETHRWQWPARLAIIAVSFIFLGGFVGKLTADYWSGQAFHTLYFIKKDYWIYNQLRSTCAPETLVTMARWFSRTAVIGEGLLAFGFWLPIRFYAPMSIVIMVGMVVISTPYLTSVMSAPIGLAVTAYWLDRQLRQS